jgi:hypothetical protein
MGCFGYVHIAKVLHTLPVNNKHPKLKADGNIRLKSISTYNISMLFS